MGLTPEQIAKLSPNVQAQIKVHKVNHCLKKCMFMNQNLSLQTIIKNSVFADVINEIVFGDFQAVVQNKNRY